MILQKVVKEDELEVLIVNLYPGNDGYSLMLKKKKDGMEVETVKLPYEVFWLSPAFAGHASLFIIINFVYHNIVTCVKSPLYNHFIYFI